MPGDGGGSGEGADVLGLLVNTTLVQSTHGYHDGGEAMGDADAMHSHVPARRVKKTAV